MSKTNKKNIKYKIIGEGGYGCVHMPALPCQSKTTDKSEATDKNDNNDYVSKLMTKKNAQKELNEFVFIGKLDKQNEYHLGQPKICNPDTANLEVMKEINKCKHISLAKVMLNSSDYKLLILEYGGDDLDDVCGKDLFKYFSKSKPKTIDRFWLEVHQLLKGLLFFQRNSIVHYDIKPQNILYNPKNGKMRFIDFGLMRSSQKIIKESQESDNGLGVLHWSYPIDNGFTNKNLYNKCKERFKIFSKDMVKMFMTYTNKNNLGIEISNIDAFYVLFKYVTLSNDSANSNDRAHYINRFLTAFQKVNSYEQYLNKVVKTIDMYGLGFTLKYALNSFYKANLINEEFYNKCSALFEDMYNFDFLNRIESAEEALNRYEQILLETDVLTRLGKTVENHVIRSGRPMSTYLPSNNINIKNKKPALSKRSVSSLVDKDVLELLKDSRSITRKRLNKKRRFNFSRKATN